MKSFYLLLTTLILGQLSFSQGVIVSSSQLNFGILNERKLDSLPITITCNSGTVLQEAQFKITTPVPYYGSSPFFVKDSVFTLDFGVSKQIWVYCKPRHNVAHNSELVIFCSAFGALSVDLRCQGRYTKTYYSSTENKRGSDLESALKTKLAENYNGLSYNNIRDEMYGDYDNHNDSVTCIYTGRKAKFNTRSGATSNNFNCEHTFPQGLFGSASPMVSDGHHLFPTDETANNSRGSLPFGIATPPYVNPAANAPSLNGGGEYEPQDSHKGNCARAMMYFRVRYQDYNNFFAPQADQLYKWHTQFSPQPKDTTRMRAIAALQNNRNPFIDYPQLADRMGHLWSTGNIEPGAVLQNSVDDSYLGIVADSFQVVIWNPSFTPIQVGGFMFLQNRLSWNGPAPQATTLQKGDAITLKFKVDSSITSQFDTLRYSYGTPAVQVSIPVVGMIIGNKKMNQTPEWTVFPNPVSDKIRISGGLSPTEFRLFNLQGKLLEINQLNSDGSIEIVGLPKGFYFLELARDGYRKAFRILKD